MKEGMLNEECRMKAKVRRIASPYSAFCIPHSEFVKG
jgi:hypothetical protein